VQRKRANPPASHPHRRNAWNFSSTKHPAQTIGMIWWCGVAKTPVLGPCRTTAPGSTPRAVLLALGSCRGSFAWLADGRTVAMGQSARLQSRTASTFLFRRHPGSS
jgi:hypothetical protein